MEPLVILFSLYLARVGTFVAVLPQWGGQKIPALVKIGLTLALTIMWFGAGLGKIPDTALRNSTQVPWLGLGMALGQEAVLGALLGYAFGLFMVPVQIAGEFLSQEMGLSFGSLVSGAGPGSASPITLILEALAVLVFLGLDGHHLFLGVFHGTFQKYPVGESLPGLPVQNLLAAATLTEEWGFMLAAPVALCLFLTTVVLALLARAAPQLNIYTVGFPLRLGVGLAAIFILLPNLLATVVSIFGNLGDLLTRLV